MSLPNVFCSSCGARNESDALYCSSCGARLAAPAPPPPAQTVPPPPSVAIPYTPPLRPASAKGSPLPLLLAVGAIVVLLLVVLLEAVLIVLPQGAVSEARGATFSLLHGQVQLQKGGHGDWIEVAQDVAVEASDRIRTGESSYAVLSFLEGTTTQLSALTELTIRELQVVPGQKVVIRLDLDLGEIRNRIAQLPADSLHEVTTLAATVTCRGSEYGMVVNEMGTTWVTGQDGRVEVTAGGSTVLTAPGDTLVVELGSPPVNYGAVAMVPTAPVQEPTGEVTASLDVPDMPTFLNLPLPSATPTDTPTATPTTMPPTPTPPRPTATATSRPQPTATTPVCPPSCPTFRINVPSGAPPYGLFGIEWDVLGGSVPAGYSYVLEFSQDQASWGRTPALKWKDAQGQGELWEASGHMNAEIHGAGPGNWYWRVCIVRSETGPSCCCGPSHSIVHERDSDGGDGC